MGEGANASSLTVSSLILAPMLPDGEGKEVTPGAAASAPFLAAHRATLARVMGGEPPGSARHVDRLEPGIDRQPLVEVDGGDHRPGQAVFVAKTRDLRSFPRTP